MTRSYLSVAIDHGTTNSAIAVMERDGPRAVMPDGNHSIMPSAIYISKFGRTLVGTPAYRAMLTKSVGEGTGYTGYKIRIGQDERYAFDEVKEVKTAPELGGLVMGELLKVAREETGDDIRGAVITVPAKFEMSAIEGTREAARLAGLSHYPLLQEPIAAALAYGFSSEEERAQWMVFDLGGGTLDISLVIVRDGQMVVPEAGHAGDNRLGGRKFDREVLDYVLQELAADYDLDGFSEKTHRSAWGRLLLAVEQAKIELSKHPRAVVELNGELCEDAAGRGVKVEVPIARDDYERMIGPDVEKALHLCQNLLNANRVRAEEVNGLILVGGPTNTPYLQQMLQDRLGIRLYKSIDPMTAVALGAAVYAATVQVENGAGKHRPDTGTEAEIQIQVEYERFSKLPRYNLVGKIETSEPRAGELFVEIHRTDGGWNSGRLPVDEDGLFEAELHLVDRGRPYLSSFKASVLDGQGHVLASVDEPEIWYPYPEGKPRLANSLRVALQGNRTDELIRVGADLPARGEGSYKTIRELRQGSAEDLLNIPIVEGVTHLLGGEDERADGAVHVGTLTIEGSDERITRDLPEGSEVELTIHQDESRELHVIAYVPLIDEEFEARFTPEPFGVSAEEAAERFEQETQRLATIRALQQESPIETVGDHLAKIDRLGVVPAIEKELERSRSGESDAVYRVWTRTLELSGALQKIWDEQREVRVAQKLNQARSGAREPSEHEQLEKIEDELRAYRENGSGGEDLHKIEADVEELDMQIRKRPFFDLGLCVSALSGLRVNPEQHRTFKEADDLLGELIGKGAPEVLSAGDLERLERAHRAVIEAYPDLSEHIARFLEQLPPGMSPQEAYGTSLKG